MKSATLGAGCQPDDPQCSQPASRARPEQGSLVPLRRDQCELSLSVRGFSLLGAGVGGAAGYHTGACGFPEGHREA